MRARSFVLPGLLLLGAGATAHGSIDGLRYVSPCPGARFVAAGTAIILRPEARPNGGVVPSLEARGTASGLHAGAWIVAEGGSTFIFRPDEAFTAGEEVHVTGVLPGPDPRPFSFRFGISAAATDPGRPPAEPEGLLRVRPRAPPPATTPPAGSRGSFTLPQDFPRLTVTVNDVPAPGYVFAGPRSPTGAPPHYAVMLDDIGWPVFFRRLPARPADFKRQKHADLYTYFQSNEFEVVDSSFEHVDTYFPENGYAVLDGHDFQILPNGNVLIGIQDYQPVDMSAVVPGGDPNAIVVGFVMQEQDAAHNVVFQWRSWDHFEITDAVGIDFTLPWIDYVHFNSFDLDTDGNILVSFRETCEMTKIDRQTGDVVWRLGGSQNEFTLVGDTRWFERQHSIRRTPTGTVTVFDNGALAAPWESRAVEYSIDEVNRIATRVWEFRDDPPRYAPYGGSVQRLPNGNTLIDWAPLGVVTEVRADGTKAFELVFDEHWTYRAFRSDWDGSAARPELWHEALPFEVTLHFQKFGDSDVGGYNIYRGRAPAPTTVVGFTAGSSFVLDVDPSEILYARVTALDSTGTIESPFSNEVLIIVPSAVDALARPGAQTGIVLHQNHPNPFVPATRISFTVPEAGLVDLSVYDVRGRLVRTLTRGRAVQGRNEVVWDGTDARGRRAGSGVYFCRLQAGSETRTRRMVRLW